MPKYQIPSLWFYWLLLVVVGVMLAGISMILAPGLIRQAFSSLLYTAAGAIDTDFNAPAVAYVTLLHGVLGAVIFAWGAALLLVLLGPLRRGSREGWAIFVVSLVAWFIPDTLFSLWTGFWQNAVLNSVSALFFVIPLIATFKSCRREHV